MYQEINRLLLQIKTKVKTQESFTQDLNSFITNLKKQDPHMIRFFTRQVYRLHPEITTTLYSQKDLLQKMMDYHKIENNFNRLGVSHNYKPSPPLNWSRSIVVNGKTLEIKLVSDHSRYWPRYCFALVIYHNYQEIGFVQFLPNKKNKLTLFGYNLQTLPKLSMIKTTVKIAKELREQYYTAARKNDLLSLGY